MEHYAGIDVSLEQSSVCVVDGTGRIVREAKVASEPEALVRFFRQLGVPVTRIGLEADTLSQWQHAGLTDAGFDTVLLETRQVKAALSAMVVKTDGVDDPRRHHRAKATAVAQSQGGHRMQISAGLARAQPGRLDLRSRRQQGAARPGPRRWPRTQPSAGWPARRSRSAEFGAFRYRR